MRYVFQSARLLGFCLAGEILHVFLPFPIPASIYGLLLLFLALCSGLVKLEQVREAGQFLVGIFPLLFVPAAAGVMELWDELGAMLLPAIIAILPVTALVLAAAGRTTQALIRRKNAAAASSTAAAVSSSVSLKESVATAAMSQKGEHKDAIAH